MTNLREAMRWMSEPEIPSSDTLLDMLISSALAIEHGDEAPEVDTDRVMSGLVRAYEGSRDDGERKLDLLYGAEAERCMLSSYRSGFLSALKKPPADRTAYDECFTWPDWLPYGETKGYEYRMLQRLGNALGYADGRVEQAGYDYFARERESA